MVGPSSRNLFPYHLDDQLPAAGADIEIDENDLLPGSQGQTSIDERD